MIVKILMAFTLTLPTISAAADTPHPNEGPAPIYLAVDKLKVRINEHGGVGRTFMEAGQSMVNAGLFSLVAGLLLSSASGTKFIPLAKFGSRMIKISGTMMTVGFIGTAAGYIVAQLEKKHKNAPPSPADPYKTPQGMEQFLNLTPEEQAAIAAEDEAFTKFIQDSARGLESLEPKSDPDQRR